MRPKATPHHGVDQLNGMWGVAQELKPWVHCDDTGEYPYIEVSSYLPLPHSMDRKPRAWDVGVQIATFVSANVTRPSAAQHATKLCFVASVRLDMC